MGSACRWLAEWARTGKAGGKMTENIVHIWEEDGQCVLYELVKDVVDGDVLGQPASAILSSLPDDDLPRLEVVLDAILRALASDTSTRVKVTIAEQLCHLALRANRAMDDSVDTSAVDAFRKRAEDLIKTMYELHRDARRLGAEHHKFYFCGWVAATSLRKDNGDLKDLETY